MAPKAVQALEAGREYFADLFVPRPHAVEIVLLKLQRLNAGLDPEGE